MPLRPLVLAGLAAAITAVLLASPAHAEGNPVQDEIDRVIALHGGEQISPNQVSWDDGDIVLTVVDENAPTPRSVGPCATGKFCAYTAPNYGGSFLTFGGCTTGNSVSKLAQVKSIANSRTSGSVKAYNGSTLVATVAPDTGKTSITDTVKTLDCD